MDSKKEIWKQSILDSLNGIKQAEVSPFFVNKTLYHIRQNQSQTNQKFILSLRISFSILSVLILLNLFAIYHSNQSKKLAEFKSSLNNNLELYE